MLDQSLATDKTSTLTWEQNQLLLLEQQQNELQLKLLKMQEELQKQAMNKNKEEQAQALKLSPRQSQVDISQSLHETMKETNGLSKQLDKLKNDIQGEQEEMIKSIVLKSAVFGHDEREYDPTKTLKNKTGAYKEEFIQSICNKSGVFVKEFREIREDPYAREEFIMSINMKSAKFDKIQDSREQELDVYQKTIQKSQANMQQALVDQQAEKGQPKQQPPVSRKKQLVYEWEVKGKMREI